MAICGFGLEMRLKIIMLDFFRELLGGNQLLVFQKYRLDQLAESVTKSEGLFRSLNRHSRMFQAYEDLEIGSARAQP